MKERTVSDLVDKLQHGYSPDEARMVCISVEDGPAISQMALLCRWMKESGIARQGFESFRAKIKAERERGGK